MNVLASLFQMRHRSAMKSLAGIPGPVPSFPFGNALDFLGKLAWEVCAGYASTYGPVTLIWLLGKPVVVLNDPTLIGQVLDTERENFYKDVPHDALLPILGSACPFLANDPEWATKRANHPFSSPDLPAWLESQIDPLREALTAGLDRLVTASASSPVDLLEAVQRLSFDTFAVAVWGRQLPDEIYRLFLSLARVGDRRIKTQISWLPPPLSPCFWLVRGRWHERFNVLLDEARRNVSQNSPALVHFLLRQGTPLSGDALRDVLANIFFGGVFSVASALTTALYLLTKYPDVEQRLQTEAAERLGPGGNLDLARLEEWEFLDCVLRESLRYYAPVPLHSRNVRKTGPVSFAGHLVPADTVVFITNWALHQSTAHYHKPDEFNPDRWAKGAGLRESTPLGSDYFFPFGRGPRMCVGLPFAWMFLKLALALLAAQVRVELDPARTYRQTFFFGVMLPRGLTARFRAG
ncbi:MAG TPA: cytochrome P450 [Gemmataceae bacterium]|jgi:cytochrome P450